MTTELIEQTESTGSASTTASGGTAPRIVVVGCGFVGSIFTTEFLKLAFAGKLPHEFLFIDSDTVEERNSANQNFRLQDAHRPKALVMRELAIENSRIADFEQVRLDGDNINDLLSEKDVLVVDAVDNLAARQLLWGFGMRTGVPVLHIGITQDGTGKVEWTHPAHDTFSLSPAKLVGVTLVEPESGVTPPCELVRMRGVGLNTSYAAAVAAALYLGFDPMSHLKGKKSKGVLTEWAGTLTGFLPISETWSGIL